MKWVKGLLWACALLALFVISALVGIALYVDPNDYKPQIEELVETHTGRDFEIAGEIDLALFPWLGLELSGVTLSNPEGFSDPHFAFIEKVNIKVALLPLLRLQTRVGTLQLKGLNVNLETRADGVTNWEDLGAAADAPVEIPADAQIPETKPAETDTEQAADGASAVDTVLANLYIGGIDIDDANITWRDASSNTLTKIQHFNFRTGAIRLNQPVDFKTSLSLRNENPKIIAGVELAGTVNADLSAETYEIKNIKMKTRASGAAIPGNEQTLELSIQSVLADLKAETARVQNLLAQVGGMKAGLDVSASEIMGDNLAVSGQIKLETDSLQRLLAALAVPMPMTADNAVFGRFKFDSRFTAGLDAVALQNMMMTFDESTLSGQFSVKNFEQPIVAVDLSLDRINADRYLPPADESEAPVMPVGDEEADPEIDLPVEELRALDLDGRLRIGALQVMNMKVADLEVGLGAKEGVINLKPLSLNLYQGQFRGEASLDVREDIPVYAVDLKLANVHFGPLLDDFMEDGFVEGVANMNATINTKGDRVSALTQGLQGKFDFAIANGALKGVNIGEKLREVRAKLQRESYTPLSTAKKTDFAEMEGGGDIKDGVVDLRKVEVASPLLRADVKGKADLVNELLDVYVNAYLVGTTTGQDGRELDEVRRIHAPIIVKGKFDAPEIKVDWNAMLQSDTLDALSAKKDAGQAKLDQQRQAAQETLAKEQAELKLKEDAMKAELEAKRKAEEEELRKRAEEKKRDLLKDLRR